MTNKNSEVRNPLFWAFISVILGAILWIGGAIWTDCDGPNCWRGSGAVIAIGITLVLAGIAYGFMAGNRK